MSVRVRVPASSARIALTSSALVRRAVDVIPYGELVPILFHFTIDDGERHVGDFTRVPATGKEIVRTDIPAALMPAFVELALRVKDAGSVRSVVFRSSDEFTPADPDFGWMRSVVRKALTPPRAGPMSQQGLSVADGVSVVLVSPPASVPVGSPASGVCAGPPPEVDVPALWTRQGFGGVKMTGMPLPQCRSSVERAYDGYTEAFDCVNPGFFTKPMAAEAAAAIGSGATLLCGITIGERALIGAGRGSSG